MLLVLIIGYVFYKLINNFSDIMSYHLFDQSLDNARHVFFLFFLDEFSDFKSSS